MKLLKTFLVVFGTALFGKVYPANENGKIGEVARDIGDGLSQLVKDRTNFEHLSIDSTANYVKKNEKKIAEEIMQKLSRLFNERLSTVMGLADYAENVYKNYTMNSTLDATYRYFDATRNETNLVQIEEEFSDEIEINLNMSVVQTPTDVYQYALNILNSIEWTKKLDKKFEEAFRETETKSKAWKYIGLFDGVLRTYPGSLWGTKKNQYFDCRQRPWYIQGSSSPKDMVIVLDMSGSVIGSRLMIVKLAVISLLDTLQENDFFNIIYFNEQVYYLKPCESCKYLIQATARNKKIFQTAIKSESIKGQHTAKVEAGFREAFELLKRSRNSTKTTSKCTQTIAFFTDGVEGDTVAEDVFNDYNNEKKVRIFTYLVGREKGSPFTAIKWIACQNKGYFYRIETLNNVRENIVKYVNVLSRSAIRKPKWTPLYVDAQGLGMLSALVAPVFDTKTDSNGKQLGVIGSDIQLNEIMSMISEYQLGPGGYGFSITNNGLIFFHPLLKKSDEVKHIPNIYLSEVERHFGEETFTEELAKAMVDREEGEKSFYLPKNKNYALAKYNEKFRIVKRKLKYFYNYIANTSFSVAIAMTDYALNEFDAQTKKKDGVTTDTTKYSISSAADWPYCNESVKNWQELSKILRKGSDFSFCKNKQLINHVVSDIGKVEGWKPNLSPNETIAVFFGTTSGLTFFKSEKPDPSFNTSVKQEYFERAADYWTTQTIVFSAPQQGEVHASKAVTIDDADGKKVLWGVAGIHLLPKILEEKLHQAHDKIMEGELDRKLTKPETMFAQLAMCSSDKDTFCYLVDENGYIIVSGKQDQCSSDEPRKFFGEVEGVVMKDLIRKNIYMKYNFTDVQASCTDGSDDSSSSIRILDPLYALINYAKWWSKTVALSFIQYSFYSIMMATSQVNAEGEKCAASTSCFKKMDLYIREDFDGVKKNDSLLYDGCKSSYESHIVNGTNLMLIIVQSQNNTYCCAKKKKIKDDPEVVDFDGSCEPKSYRREPEEVGGCLPKAKETRECSSGKSLIPSLVLVILLQFVFLLKRV